ncbi:MAG: rRNA maturation RNAse YbeY, partial [Nitrospirae bacterium]|nr:rRNA maturation RNAse YbeY [Nitrospirota bacterium]
MIRRLNRRYRGIDKTTDILSFPQYDRSASPAAHCIALSLGDIV